MIYSGLTASDIALLKATLRRDGSAVDAFHEWRTLTDFEGEHKPGHFRMLPLLHANMSRLGLCDPIMARLKGVHRYAWVESQRRKRSAIESISALHAAGIPVMTVKGLALSKDYYADASLRPMQDIDLLVPFAQANQALAALARQGWVKDKAAWGEWPLLRAVYMAQRNGIELQRMGQVSVDLHWHVMHECNRKDLAALFWQEPEWIDIGVRVMRPRPAALLLLVVSHGMRPNPLPSLRWVADAAMILQRPCVALDWQNLWRMARIARLENRMVEGLRLVSEIAGINLAEAVDHVPRSSLIEALETRAFHQMGRADAAVDPRSRPSLWARGLLVATNVLRFWNGSHRNLLPALIALRLWRFLKGRLKRDVKKQDIQTKV